MNHHQQTLRDLETMREPSPLAIAGYTVLTVAAVACALLFAFTI